MASRSTIWRRKRRAATLGCSVNALPDGRGRHSNHVWGSISHRWNHGKLVSSHGYAKVRVGKTHPLADPNGYAYEHLLVWLTSGNSEPKDGEVIHHINEDKTDNRIENLVLMDNIEHLAQHNSRPRKNGRRYKAWPKEAR